MKVNEQDELYNDPRFEMYSGKSQFKAVLAIYGVAFAIVIFGIAPWAIGSLMLIKWIVF